jgi:hypothetical protein
MFLFEIKIEVANVETSLKSVQTNQYLAIHLYGRPHVLVSN